jgi:hypothetical protein
MKKLIIILIVLFLAACATTEKPVNTYQGTLPELYRAGTPNVAEPVPNYYHRVSHTCTSTPIYDMDGYYIRTDVRCH